MTHSDEFPAYEPRVSWEPVQPTVGAVTAAPATPGPVPSRRTPAPRGLLIAGAFIVVAAVVVTLALTLTSTKQKLTIEYGLMDIDGGSDCSGGSGGYGDIGPGMPVTVSDEKGQILASTVLPEEGEGLSGIGCIWTMEVAVDDDAEQYSVEGGRRGAVTYSHEQLEHDDWKVSVGVGD